MRTLIGLAAISLFVSGAMAANIEFSSWESFPVGDTGVGCYGVDVPLPDDLTEPLLGKYGNVDEMVDDAFAHSGEVSLKLIDMSSSGPSTPQAYIGWVENLQAGDQVTASMWVYDTTPEASPSARIWGHFNSENDIDSYAGSAGGNDDFGPGTGWHQVEWTWTFDPGTDRTGLVIEVRTYSTDGDTVWIDDVEISAPDHAIIAKPQIPEPPSVLLFALTWLVLRRR